MNCETRHIHNPDCLDWLYEHRCLHTDHNLILYFMGEFDWARLWTGAMRLAYLLPRLRELSTDVVLVGEGDEARMGAAARLAEALDLPFPLVADNQRTLWRRCAPPELGKRPAGLILVDSRGRPAGSWCLQPANQRLEPSVLLSTLEALAES